MAQWTPEEWWKGDDAFIIGGGPSLRHFDWSQLIGRKTVGCNDAFRLGPEVCSVCVFGDLRWFNIHRSDLQKYPNPVFTNQPSLHKGKGFHWLRCLPRESRGLHSQALGWGGNTGCTAINLALILGAYRVFLLGFDLRVRDGKTNWHDCNLGKPNDASYRRFIRGFQAVAADLPHKFPGRTIYNCTPDSGLLVFPKMSLEEALSARKEEEAA